MKAAPLLIALILTLASTAAEAGNGNAYGHQKGQGSDNGNASNGRGAGNGNAYGHDNAIPDAAVYSPEGLMTTGADQNIALEALTSGEALPLDQIEPVAMRQWGGRVIDAHLQKTNGTYLYRLTMVSDDGISRKVYYEARTGRSVVVH
jgi:uncharacterized membrane protein YkoI